VILLTGLPRTGTTWAGRVLAAAMGGTYTNEPFNWKSHPDREEWHMRYLLGDDGPSGFDAIVAPTVGERTVVKDVHSCLAVERWSRHHPHVVLQVRHPCAVAASWAALDYRADWQADILLAQPEVMERHLEQGRDALVERGDLFHDIGAYWGATYRVLADLADDHPGWRWSVHERLCAEPTVEYRLLLSGLSIDETALDGYLADSDRAPAPGDSPYVVTRRTGAEPDKWRTQLEPDQIERVMAAASAFGVLDRWYEAS
jgi:hypothetical protein